MYLLLRNNKQSGPFTLDELKNMGLKAYDLVWLEGKSAAWRYPSEIEELSAFAPPVEEQPFDRFYKKPAASSTPKPAVEASATQTIAQPVTVESTRTPGKRIIYVTMPAGRTAAPGREPAPVIRETPIRETPAQPAPVIRETVPPIEDYSSQQPADEATTVEFLPRRRQQRSSSSGNLVKYLAIGVCILALLAAGIFIGLSLNKNSLGIPSRIASTPVTTAEQVHRTAQQLPPAPVNTQSTRDSVPPIISQPITTPAKTIATTPKTSKSKPHPATQAAVPPADPDSNAGITIVHREATHRTDPVETPADNGINRDAIRTALASQVAVGANSYTIGTFGGINNLQLTVTNRSVYPLDLVIVEVQYIQANKKVYKTENLYFRSIAAGAALMQEAPKSSRGVKVQYRITSISSKDGVSYSGL